VLPAEADGEDDADTPVTATTADPTAAGYDEAVEARDAFIAEPEILAQYSADPVALTEAEPVSEAEIVMQEPGRDLRPDTIVPAPDITSAEAAAIESLDELDLEIEAEAAAAGGTDDMSQNEPTPAPAVSADAASESNDEEKQDASPDAAN
jgi:hypothetical protein